MPSSRRAAVRALTTAALLLLGLAGCGGGGDSSAAPDDRRITVYSGRSESLVKPLLDRFSKQTGIAVQVRYASTAAMATQLIEEGDKTPADVFLSQDAGALGAVAKNGLFATLDPDVVNRVPRTYRAASGEWVGVTARARVLVYNADLVPEEKLPASVFELTEPAWKGKVAVAPANASFQTFVTAVRVQHGDARAKEFLAGLKANEPIIRDGNVVIVEEVDAGRIPVGLVNHYYLGEVAKEKGATPDALKARLHFFPGGDSGALVNVSGVGVLKRSAQDPDTRAFVDYLLGPDAQRYFAEEVYEYPVIGGVPGPGYVPPLADLRVPEVDLNDLDQLEATIAMIKESGLVP